MVTERYLDLVTFYRERGFFGEFTGLSHDQIAARLESANTERSGQVWVPPTWRDELGVVTSDQDRIWWEDTEWMGDLRTMYTDILQGWARISRGLLHVSGISERWDSDEGPVVVEHTLNGVRRRFTTESVTDWIDPSILFGPNGVQEALAPTGYRYENVNTDDQTWCLVVLNAAEKAALKERGWKFDEPEGGMDSSDERVDES